MLNLVTVKKRLFPEVSLWAARVLAAGGGLETNSVAIANGFIRQLKTKSYAGKMVYLLPLLGAGIGAARTPLVDVLNVGMATSAAFTGSDFSQSTGLQGDGSTKYLDTLLTAAQIGAGGNGGLGYWENNISFGANVEPIGSYGNAGNSRFVLDLRSNVRQFRWGAPANGGGDSGAAVNGHYYGQRVNATDRDLYFNASLVGTNSTSDPATGTSDNTIYVVGANEGSPAPWPGRCAVAYLTDGTLTTGEITDFDALLRSTLLGPTGRPSS